MHAVVRRATTKSVGTARTADVVRIAATIFVTVESAFMATADRFDATSAKDMADGGLASPVANGAMRTQSKVAKTSSVGSNGTRCRNEHYRIVTDFAAHPVQQSNGPCTFVRGKDPNAQNHQTTTSQFRLPSTRMVFTLCSWSRRRAATGTGHVWHFPV